MIVLFPPCLLKTQIENGDNCIDFVLSVMILVDQGWFHNTRHIQVSESNFWKPKLILQNQNQFCMIQVDFSTPGTFLETIKCFEERCKFSHIYRIRLKQNS